MAVSTVHDHAAGAGATSAYALLMEPAVQQQPTQQEHEASLFEFVAAINVCL
jgi:hypothetical protein